MKNTELGIVDLVSIIRKRSNIFIEQELKKRGIDGIVPAHGAVLKCLFEQSEAVPLSVIVRKTSRAKSTITVTLRNLEKNEYIKRLSNDKDARSNLIELTEKGRRLEQDFYDISVKLERYVCGGMSLQKKTQLSTLLREIVERTK